MEINRMCWVINQDHLALRHPDGVVTGEGVAILSALPGGKVNKPGGRVKVTSASQNLKINWRLVLMMQCPAPTSSPQLWPVNPLGHSQL